MDVKEIIHNSDLINSIAEDIGDTLDDAAVTYEVWAIGYKDDELADTELFIDVFVDPDEAVNKAKSTTLADLTTILSDITESFSFSDLADTIDYFSIEVETVIEDINENDVMNVGTIYQNKLLVEDKEDVLLSSGDYTFLEDGSLKVSCKLLKSFNESDRIKVRFADDAMSCYVIFKIISKVTYKDGDYFHCELII